MKVKLSIIKTISYSSEVYVELPHGMDLYDFSPMVEDVEGKSKYDTARGFVNRLESEYGYKPYSTVYGTLEAPDESILEVVDFDIVKVKRE